MSDNERLRLLTSIVATSRGAFRDLIIETILSRADLVGRCAAVLAASVIPPAHLPSHEEKAAAVIAEALSNYVDLLKRCGLSECADTFGDRATAVARAHLQFLNAKPPSARVN